MDIAVMEIHGALWDVPEVAATSLESVLGFIPW
jgi:hypothetical protein